MRISDWSSDVCSSDLCVTDVEDPAFQEVEKVRLESVVCITGRVVRRSPETINARLDTGHVEVRIDNFEVLSAADQVPLQVNSDEDAGEEIRLRYRYLDLRRERVHKNIMLRSQVITSIRRRMVARSEEHTSELPSLIRIA